MKWHGLHKRLSRDDKSAAGIDERVAQNADPVEHDASEAPRKDIGEPSADCGRLRIVKSIAIYASFLGLGLSTSVQGPTQVSMEGLLATNTSGISWVFISNAVGFICSAFLCSAMFDRMNREVQLAIAALLAGVLGSCAPFTGNLYGFVIMCGVQSVAHGFTGAGSEIQPDNCLIVNKPNMYNEAK